MPTQTSHTGKSPKMTSPQSTASGRPIYSNGATVAASAMRYAWLRQYPMTAALHPRARKIHASPAAGQTQARSKNTIDGVLSVATKLPSPATKKKPSDTHRNTP